MKKVIHINQHNIKYNRKNDDKKPVITCKTYKTNNYSDEVIIYGQDGKEAAKIVYKPNKPLSCGAHVWVETHNDVKFK